MSPPGDVIRVGIDVTAIPAKSAGAGRYVIELVRALSGRDDIAIELFARRGDRARWSVPPSTTAGRVRAIAPDSRAGRLVFGELLLGRVAHRVAPPIDLFFGPHYTYPRFTDDPIAVTVHDLTLVDHPEWHERSKARFFARAINRAAGHAQAISIPAARDAARFVERYRPIGEVATIPHGVDHERFSPVESAAGEDRDVLGRLGVSERYVLIVGTIEPRKNHPVVVEAFEHLAERDRDVTLLIAGQDGWGTEPLTRVIAASRFVDRIHRVGYVADNDLPALLRSALCVLYPSSAEGFGLPALEALACGTVLITTPDTPMSDLAGPSALLVPAGDPDALADALVATVVDGTGNTDRRAAGIAIAQQYTWEASADAHAALWRRAIERSA